MPKSLPKTGPIKALTLRDRLSMERLRKMAKKGARLMARHEKAVFQRTHANTKNKNKREWLQAIMAMDREGIK